jgi:hypothetical protein
MIAEVLLFAAATAAQPPQPGHLNRYHGVRNIAGCPATKNGVLWMPDQNPRCETPGSAYYGARDTGQVVYARVGELTISISPWQQWNDESFPRLEAARQQWLREQGLVGGVRTFMNDAAVTSQPLADLEPITPRQIKPTYIIPVPEDMPRLRSRMQVDASELQRAIDRIGRRQRVPIVLPLRIASR